MRPRAYVPPRSRPRGAHDEKEERCVRSPRSLSRWCSPSPFRRSRAVMPSSSPMPIGSRTRRCRTARALRIAARSARRASLRHQLQRVHGRTVALAHRAALPVPPPPRLGWHRTALRVQLDAPGARARPLPRAGPAPAAACASSASRPGSASTGTRRAWNDSGDPYWGGLQMDRGFMRAYGSDMIARHQRRPRRHLDAGRADRRRRARLRLARLRAVAEHRAQLRASSEAASERA